MYVYVDVCARARARNVTSRHFVSTVLGLKSRSRIKIAGARANAAIPMFRVRFMYVARIYLFRISTTSPTFLVRRESRILE